MKKMNRKGFTIVELVIVIAVIAILAGVLIPTFSGIIGRAQDSAAIQEARNKYTEYVGAHDYTKGDPAKNIVIELGDGAEAKYVTVIGAQLKDKVYKSTELEAAKTAAGAGAAFICDKHNWGTKDAATGVSTCADCAGTHNCDTAGASNKCSVCGK